MKLKYRRDLKASRPPNQKSVKFKDVSFPIYKQSFFSCCTRPPPPTHTPISISTTRSPSPPVLPHPCPIPRGRTLGKAIALRWAQVWVCSAFGCVFVACVACGPIDHSLLLVVGRGTTSMNTSIWIVLGISASPWSRETRGQGFSLSHQYPQGCWAVTSVSW